MDRASGSIAVSVVYSPRAGVVDETQLRLPAGATLVEALRASGILERQPQIDLAQQAVGIWGRLAPLARPLQPSDRIEIYRPLAVDPKEARRVRQRQQREERKRR